MRIVAVADMKANLFRIWRLIGLQLDWKVSSLLVI